MAKNATWTALVGLALGALASCATPAVQSQSIAQGWRLPSQTVVIPENNVGLDAWEAFKTRHPTPSVDQHLDDPVLHGAIDVHSHFGPDSYGRQWDAFEIAKMAQERGMRGVVFKNHWSETAGLAYLIRHYDTPGLEVFGGLALNTTVGGVNPQAVRYFAEVEGGFGRVVWLPTHDSESEVLDHGAPRPYVRVSENGALLPEVGQVLDLIAQYRLTLATGHVSADEMLMVMREAQARGITHIIITHPNLGPGYTDPTIPQLQQAVALGGFAEFVSGQLLRDADRDATIAMIRAVGPEHCIISSDSGLVGTPNLADALVLSARVLRAAGFSEADLDLMFKRNPAFVLGLPLH